MMTVLPRILSALLLLAATAAAGEPAAFREAARDFIRTPSPFGEYEKEKKVRELAAGTAEAPAIWIEEVLAAGVNDSVEWYLANMTERIFDGRADEVKPLVVKLLKDGAEPKERFGAEIACGFRFDVELADLLVPLLDKGDSSSHVVRGCFQQSKDDHVAELLIAVADKPGRGSDEALGCLGSCDAPKAQVYLRGIAADRSAPLMRRREALGGLAPLTEEQDLKLVRDAVDQESGELLYAAVLALHESDVTAGLESLRKARKRIPANGPAFLTHLLCAAGDPEAFEAVLRHEGTEDAGGRTADAQWAVRSPLPGRIPRIIKALETESDDWCRGVYLHALGESGDVACLKPLVASLGSGKDNQETVAAIASLIDKHPGELKNALEAILDLEDPGTHLIEFHQAWVQKQAGGLAAFTVEGKYIVLLRANIHEAPRREALCLALRDLAGVQIEDKVSDLKKWEAWWVEECARNKTE